MREKGLPRAIVLSELEKMLQVDFSYSSGKILSSMCTQPHEFAKLVYAQCIDKNMGDPSLFPSTAQLEKRAIQILGSLLSNPEASGFIVSGGTEANIIALWAARNSAKKTSREVILPLSAHFSFDKAANLLGLKLVKVRLNERFQLDTQAVAEAITPRTMAIVGVAGTTGLGTVDPIPELSEIAKERDLHLHVDAAFGGFVIPFLKDLGFDLPDFDFRLHGVRSITIDPHKMGLAPTPAGGILFREASMVKAVGTKIPYLSGGEAEQSTIVGTRPGASAAAVWALLEHLGREEYREVVNNCMSLTRKLAEGICRIEGLSLVTRPTINIIGVKSDLVDVGKIARELRERGWTISLWDEYIRIVIMPHLRSSDVESFLEDLRDITTRLANNRSRSLQKRP